MHVLQLLRGGSEETLRSLHLQNDPARYRFTREGAAAVVSPSAFSARSSPLSGAEAETCTCAQTSNNDRAAHRAVLSALDVMGFSQEEVRAVYQTLASILLLVAPLWSSEGLRLPP